LGFLRGLRPGLDAGDGGDEPRLRTNRIKPFVVDRSDIGESGINGSLERVERLLDAPLCGIHLGEGRPGTPIAWVGLEPALEEDRSTRVVLSADSVGRL
jgi:hypothetical protein